MANFVTTFACYMKQPEMLRESCPNTYEYIDNYIMALNAEYSEDTNITLTK